MKTIEIETRAGRETHVYYTKDEADEIGMAYLDDWRQASGEGQRVLTDDGFVVPVLRVSACDRDMEGFVRIPTGTFMARPSVEMDTEKRTNRFNFSGEEPQVRVTNRVRLFAFNVANTTGDPYEVHRQIWPDMREKSRRSHLKRLLASPEVKELMRKELKTALEHHGINDEYILGKLKEMIERDEGVSDGTMFGVLDRMMDLVDKTDETTGQAQIPGQLAGLTLEAIKQVSAGGQVVEESKTLILEQNVGSKALIGEEPDLDASGYEDVNAKEETIEDRDAEDDAQ